MTVAQLIALLQQQPQDALVLTRGYESGFEQAGGLDVLDVIHCPGLPWYEGTYQSEDSYGVDPAGQRFRAVFINNAQQGD